MKYCGQCHANYPAELTTCPKDQCVLVEAAELAPGMVLRGKYQVLENVGSGGMASVYRVRHLHLREDVAIKVVSSRLAEDREFVERFQSEAVITRKLRHPNAVRLDDFDVTDDGRPFIVMEFVRGRSLREVLQNGWLAPARAAAIARQVALALGAAHQLGIVHRDIKPENILLIQQPDGSELVKVLDFGIARMCGQGGDGAAGHTPTRTGIILGTPQYISPEQAKGTRSTELDGRSDLYSLGVVLYEMLTGEPPFTADSPFDLLLKHVQTPPTPPHLLKGHENIAPAMSALVMNSLEKNPAQRFQTAAEMVDALSDPAVAEEADRDGSAHVFSTIALAEAAAAMNGSQLGEVAVLSAQATLPMGSSAATGARRVTIRTSARALDELRRHWKISVAACVAFAMLLAGYVAFRGSYTAATDDAVHAAAPVAVTSPPVQRKQQTARRVPTKATAAAISDQARAQTLVATGYRRLEQRDFNGARDAFEQALQIDPGNASAQQGLKAAQGAQAVESISGILHR